MSYRSSFNWPNDSQYIPSFHIFETAVQANDYAEARMDKVEEINDYKVVTCTREATHIFADGRLYQMHDNAELWKGILGESDEHST